MLGVLVAVQDLTAPPFTPEQFQVALPDAVGTVNAGVEVAVGVPVVQKFEVINVGDPVYG